MLIYRIETKKGRGPFAKRNYTGYMGTMHDNSVLFPSIGEDLPDYFERKDANEYFCACPDKASFLSWFPEHILNILPTKFWLFEIEVTEVVMGNSGRQCFYKKENIVSQKRIFPKDFKF